MGCNSWNHPADCDCGWGGDTGGTRSSAGRSGVRSLRVTDGFTWRLDRRPIYDDFVNPNAICPVCGASAYFYQSPSGGRVFFDELGPPWPKHPCTDNGPSSSGRVGGHDFIIGPKYTSVRASLRTYSLDEWRPLLVEEILHVGDLDRIRVPTRERLPGKFLCLPGGWVGDAPAFWRWRSDDPSLIEVSCIRLNAQNEVETKRFSVASWLCNDEDLEKWRVAPTAYLTPEVLNSIGFALSFAWKNLDVPFWYLGILNIDFSLARSYFEQAAESGYWAALNNLGVMYRDGLGIAPDHAKAFDLFRRAAQTLQTTALRHLANCYRDGIGCEPDPEFQLFLDDLITVSEKERNSVA